MLTVYRMLNFLTKSAPRMLIDAMLTKKKHVVCVIALVFDAKTYPRVASLPII